MPRPALELNPRLIPSISLQSPIRVPRYGAVMFQNLSLLRTHGCFEVPNSDTLNVFFQHFFLYIHPLMPILDEAQFWKSYSFNLKVETISEPSLPLILLFAILYTSVSVS